LRNRIRDGLQSGAFCYDQGTPTTIPHSDPPPPAGIPQAGVAIETGANPTLFRNRIYDGLQSGVFCYDQGFGLLQENDIFNNLTAGIQIVEGADPVIEHNTIREQRKETIKEV
jgi:hypothetical protein